MLNKKIEIDIPIWFIFLVALIALYALYLFLNQPYVPKQNAQPANTSDNEIITPNAPYITRKSSMDPNSDFWNAWGKKISLAEAKDGLAFDLVLPKNGNRAGKLITIITEGKPPEFAKKEKSRAVVLFYSSGIKVMESYLNEVPPTKLTAYKKHPGYEKLKKELISVFINGIEGIAGKPGSFKNSNGVIETKPGVITWYRKPLLYTVYGNGRIPLEKLLEVAKLFNQ